MASNQFATHRSFVELTRNPESSLVACAPRRSPIDASRCAHHPRGLIAAPATGMRLPCFDAQVSKRTRPRGGGNTTLCRANRGRPSSARARRRRSDRCIDGLIVFAIAVTFRALRYSPARSFMPRRAIVLTLLLLVVQSWSGHAQDLAADLDAHVREVMPVSYTHLRAHETVLDLVCRLLLEKKKHT